LIPLLRAVLSGDVIQRRGLVGGDGRPGGWILPCDGAGGATRALRDVPAHALVAGREQRVDPTREALSDDVRRGVRRRPGRRGGLTDSRKPLREGREEEHRRQEDREQREQGDRAVETRKIQPTQRARDRCCRKYRGVIAAAVGRLGEGSSERTRARVATLGSQCERA